MASNPTVIHVRPDDDDWQVRIGESPVLMLQSKQTAVAEAHVQDMLSQPSRVLVHAADGRVEDQPATRPSRPTPPAGVWTERPGRRARSADNA